MKKIKIIDIVLCIIIMLTNLYVGTPLKYNIDIINIIINITAIIYICLSYIKNKQNLELNKIDIFVIIIALATFIPLVTNKYLRLRDTIYYIIKYISMLNLYFIVKKYIKIDKRNIKIITNTVILMSIILVFFGIDLLTANLLEGIYKFFQIPELYNKATYSMSSLFKYANAFAMFINFCLFITLGCYFNETENEKKKNIYGMCVFFQMFGVLASYSRSALIIQISFIILFWLFAKEKRKEMVKIILISEINAIIYFMLFAKFRISGKFIEILIFLLFIAILNYILLFKIKIKNKKSLLIICLSFIVVILVLIILSPNSLILFNNTKAKASFRKQNIKVQPNTNYSIKINMNAISVEKDNFSILVRQIDEAEKSVKETQIKFDNYDGTKEINITTESNTKTISMFFQCYNVTNDTKLEIRSVYINGRKVNVDYGLIPVELINKFKKLNIDSISVQARVAYIKEALEIANTNFIFGYGGNAWRFYPKTLDIEDSIAEHSYPIQLLVQFGIVALLAYVILIVLLIIKIYKYLKISKNDFLIIGISLAIFMIVIHSIGDFEMSFFNILLTFYSYVAILSTSLQEDKIKINYRWMYLCNFILAIFLYINIGGFVAYNIKTDDITDKEEKLKLVNVQIALAPYDYSYKKDKVNCLSTLKNTNIYERNSDKYYNACKSIIKNQKFIIEIEKLKDEYEYKTLLYNKIDLITEENQEKILSEITDVLTNKTLIYNNRIKDGIKSRLLRTLNNQKTKEYLQSLDSM